MIRLLSVFAATCALAGIAPAEDDVPGPKIEFPDVKGLTRSKVRTFPKAELGYSVAYNTPGFAATIYVYNLGMEKIPAGTASDEVKSEMKRLVKELDAVAKQGVYKSVKQLGMEETVRFGKGKDAPAALRRRFEVEVKDGARLSEAYVTGYKNHFVKIRITHDPDDKAAPEKITALLEALGPVIK